MKELYVETKVQDSDTSKGLKFDAGKLRMSLVQPEYIEDIARVLTFGADKYEPNSWQTIPDAKERYEDALLRHTMSYLKGEKYDEESGLTHLSHMATNIMFLSYFDRNSKDTGAQYDTTRG